MQRDTALIEAASNGHTEMVQFLLDADADADSRTNDVGAADGIDCLSQMSVGLIILLVCNAGHDCARLGKALRAHTDRPTAL